MPYSLVLTTALFSLSLSCLTLLVCIGAKRAILWFRWAHQQLTYLSEPALRTPQGLTLTRQDLLDTLLRQSFLPPGAPPATPQDPPPAGPEVG